MSSPFPPPKQTSGKIILLAQATAKPGKADEVETLLKACRAAAENDEKDTLTYRTTRGVEGDSDKFAVWEEYVLPNGLTDHVANKPFQALAAADLLTSLDIQYFNEFQ
ncbi:hypothetical protein BCR35DRAFT_37387 [Leucosporidium creatinivorum]|uniref:ABM domain-containing protein n=1 Tax=Leucosporidium creatinivorum TaxID=106004 RepID=A0A1Y2FUZ1_9BASI|nr:hypothetical protein BCR35DRAFT_37387 [Leucosporidium creatinivorum]